jgi:hypothetical protein
VCVCVCVSVCVCVRVCVCVVFPSQRRASRVLITMSLATHLTMTRAGDVLVFLTGREEIERACDELFQRSEKLDYKYDVRRQ